MYVVFQEALLYGTIIVAFWLWSWWPLIIGAVALFSLPYALWWRSPLIVRTEAQIARDRRNAGIALLVLGALVLMAGAMHG